MVGVFSGELLGCDCGAGNNGPWYRISFISGMDTLRPYANEDVFKQMQGLPRMTSVILGIDVQERRSGGWSGRVVEAQIKK